MHKLYRCMVFVIIGMALISCQAKTQQPTLALTVLAPTVAPQGAYPYPVSTLPASSETAYPATTFSLETYLPSSLTIPTPAPDRGVVTGILITADHSPYVGALFLAKAIPANQEGYPPLVSFSEKTDPQATMSSRGQFLFTDIDPGEYALALWAPGGSMVIPNKEKDGFIIFKVEAGKMTDLHEIVMP